MAKFLRTYKKGMNKKKYKKMKRKSKAVKINTGPDIVADRLITRLKYVKQISITCPVGAMSGQIWGGNDIYDPDQSGAGGHSVTGLSIYKKFYRRYKVYGSKCKVQVLTAGDASPYHMSLVPQTTNTAQGELEYCMMNTYAKNRIFSINNPYPASISHYMGTEKILGLNKKAVEIDDVNSALVTTGPSRPWYWYLYVQPANQTSTSTLLVLVEITYYVEFFDRINTLTPFD